MFLNSLKTNVQYFSRYSAEQYALSDVMQKNLFENSYTLDLFLLKVQLSLCRMAFQDINESLDTQEYD